MRAVILAAGTGSRLTETIGDKHKCLLRVGDQEMKIKVRRGSVVEITKTMPPGEADGENVGIAKFGAAGARLLAGVLDARVAAGGLREWVPHAFADFARMRPLHAVGTRGYPWTEIDFPEDYEHAVAAVLPAIEHDAERVTEVRVQRDATVVVHGLRLQHPAPLPLSPAGGE